MSGLAATGRTSIKAPRAPTIPSIHALKQQPLATARTRLAPIAASDSNEMWEALESSRVHLEQWLPWVSRHTTPESCLRYTNACVREWLQGKALRFTIRAHHTGSFLGVVGLENLVHEHMSCDLGYWLCQHASGAGVMTEAAQCLIDFGFGDLGLHRVRCAAALENTPSLRVISKLQFKPEGVARQAEFVATRWVDHAVFARLSID